MKDITIIDNFISDEELKEARQCIIIPGTTCKFTHNGQMISDWFFNTDDKCDKKFIIDTTTIGGINNTHPHMRTFILKIQNRIEKYMNKKFTLWRAYLNRQVYGQDVALHTDDNKYHAYTLVLYIGDITRENYDRTGGDLKFKNEENTRIEPFVKRAVLFKGYIPHQIQAPLVPGITRISFAFKLFCMSERLPFITNTI